MILIIERKLNKNLFIFLINVFFKVYKISLVCIKYRLNIKKNEIEKNSALELN